MLYTLWHILRYFSANLYLNLVCFVSTQYEFISFLPVSRSATILFYRWFNFWFNFNPGAIAVEMRMRMRITVSPGGSCMTYICHFYFTVFLKR